MSVKKGIATAIVVVVVVGIVFGLYQTSWRAPPAEKPEEYVVKVSVVNKHTKRPVEAMIDINPLEDQRTSAHAILMSHLTAVLEKGLYRVEVTATNYQGYSDVIRVDRDLNVVVELDIVIVQG